MAMFGELEEMEGEIPFDLDEDEWNELMTDVGELYC